MGRDVLEFEELIPADLICVCHSCGIAFFTPQLFSFGNIELPRDFEAREAESCGRQREQKRVNEREGEYMVDMVTPDFQTLGSIIKQQQSKKSRVIKSFI